MNTKRALKWGVISIFSLVILAIIAIIIALMTMDQDAYRALIVKAVKHYTGCPVEINGDFSFDLDAEPTLLATDITFATEDPPAGCPSGHIGHFKLQVKASQLFSKVIFIRRLELHDVTIDFHSGEQKDSDKNHLKDQPANPGILIPIVESASLKDIAINIAHPDTDYITNIRLNSYNVDDIDNTGPLFIRGTGSVDEFAFRINGKLGPLSEMIEPSGPYPIDLKVNLGESALRAAGTVDDFLRGRGLNIRIAEDAADASRIFRFFGLAFPPIGERTLRATITGDADAPALSDFSFHMSDGKVFDVHAKGSVDNLLTGRGAHISFSGACSQQDILKLIIPDSAPLLTNLILNGDIRETKGILLLSLEKAHGQTETGITADTTGTIRFDDRYVFKGLDLALQATAPNTEAIKPYLFEYLPKSGPVTATATLSGTGEIFTLENLVAKAPVTTGLVAISVEGSIGKIPLDDRPISQIDLSVSLASATSALVTSAFEVPLPELGKMVARTNVRGSSRKFSLEEFSFSALHSQGLASKAFGTLRFVDRKDLTGFIDLQTEFFAPTLAALTPVIDIDIAPYLAPVEVQGHITGTTDRLAVKHIVAQLGYAGPLKFDVSGSIDTINLSDDDLIDGVDLRAKMQADNMSSVSRLVGRHIPDMGPTTGTARIKSRKGSIDVSDISLIVDSGKEFHVKAQGSVDTIHFTGDQPFDGFTAVISASGDEINALTALIDFPFPDFGPFESEADVAYHDNYLKLKKVTFSAKGNKGQSFTINATGKTEPRHNRSTVNATFVTSTQPWVEEFLQSKNPEPRTVSGAAQLTFTPNKITVQDITAALNDKSGFVIKAQGTINTEGDTFKTDLNLMSKIDTISVVEPILGIELPAVPSGTIKGKILGDADSLAFKGKAILGTSEMTVFLSKAREETKSFFSGTITAPSVNLADVGIHPKQIPDEMNDNTKASKNPSRVYQHIFQDTPLPFEELVDWNGSLHIDIKQLNGENVTLNDLEMKLIADAGVYRLSPAKLTYAEGGISGEAMIDVTKEMPEVSLKMHAEDINLGSLLAHAHHPLIAQGMLTFLIDATASGKSPRNLASTLSGEVALAVENGKTKRTLDLLAPDATDLVTGLRGLNKYVDLNCLLVRFIFLDGVGVSNTIHSDTDQTTTTGAGKIDLKTEEIDLVLHPKKKTRKFGLSSAARVHGPLRNPKIRKIPVKEAANLTAEILMPYVFLPARGLGYLWYMVKKDKEGSPCVFEEE